MRTPQPLFNVPIDSADDAEGWTFLGSVWDNGDWYDMYSKGSTVSVRWGEHITQASTNELRYAHMLGGVQRIAAKLAGY